MTIEAVGLATWEDLTPIQQTELVERQVWKPNEYDKFIAERAQNPRLQKKWTKEAGGSLPLMFAQSMPNYENNYN